MMQHSRFYVGYPARVHRAVTKQLSTKIGLQSTQQYLNRTYIACARVTVWINQAVVTLVSPVSARFVNVDSLTCVYVHISAKKGAQRHGSVGVINEGSAEPTAARASRRLVEWLSDFRSNWFIVV